MIIIVIHFYQIPHLLTHVHWKWAHNLVTKKNQMGEILSSQPCSYCLIADYEVSFVFEAIEEAERKVNWKGETQLGFMSNKKSFPPIINESGLERLAKWAFVIIPLNLLLDMSDDSKILSSLKLSTPSTSSNPLYPILKLLKFNNLPNVLGMAPLRSFPLETEFLNWINFQMKQELNHKCNSSQD